jgi:hypothetical protein
MNKNGQITKSTSAVTRPLRTLVPLIKRDLYQIDRFRKQSEPYRLSAGQKLHEASKSKELGKVGGWYGWLKKNFVLSSTTADRYIKFYKEHSGKGRKKPSRVEEAKSYTEFLDRHDMHGRSSEKKAKETIGSILGGIDADLYAQKIKDRRKEIELREDLARKLVEAGFRLLAKELHPDKGGSSELMRRLQAVRKALLDLCRMIGSDVEMISE